LASDNTKSEVVARFVSILKLAGEKEVRVYEEEFFRATDLKYLLPQDCRIVKDHLLSRLDADVTVGLLKSLDGIGKFLEPDETNKLIDPLITAVVYGTDEELRKPAQDAIVSAWLGTPGGSKTEEAINKRLDEWVTHLQSRNRPSEAEKVRQINERCSAIPFEGE
jgi:hypothetical protein